MISVETCVVSIDSMSQNLDVICTFIEYQPIGIRDDWFKLMCGCRKIMLIEIGIILEEEISNEGKGERMDLLEVRIVWE